MDTIQENARIENVSNKTTFQYGSATEIPFEDNKFDIGNISSVLHEIHDEEFPVSNIVRLNINLNCGCILLFLLKDEMTKKVNLGLLSISSFDNLCEIPLT